ncbi:Cutinase [Pseudozyma hubeiensis]|nr:Cutinase [Pseudozyma hubeiensis]
MFVKPLFLALVLAIVAVAQAMPMTKRVACSSYVIIDTRGTGELQGPSAGFRTMNARILSSVSGGSEYDTVYPADFSQISTLGTINIVAKVKNTLASNPNACFVLEGYSQGAAATVAALPQLTGSAFDAVKAVILIGNPDHKPNLACNVDNNGGKSTAGFSGISALLSPGIPSNWVSKSLDICIFGDGVCAAQTGLGITFQHLLYPTDLKVQSMGADFAIKALQG